MRKSFLAALIFLFGFAAHAGSGPFLLGVILGDPTGLSGRHELSRNTALDGALSWSNGTHRGAQLHGDYLVIKPNSLAAGDSFLDVYYGIGLRMISISSDKYKGDLSLGPRAPLGLKYELRDPTVEFFGEVALVLDLIPETDADLEVGVGARYRF